MSTCDDGRMAELLWLVGYCGDFPTQLASRIGGHPEWNRHVMYRAIKQGYLSVWRGKYHQRIVRSLRITESGLDYVGSRNHSALALVLAQIDAKASGSHPSVERVVRAHSLAYGLVMARNAGALILPNDKPALTAAGFEPDCQSNSKLQKAYFYSAAELRRANQELDNKAVPKGSRIIGVIVIGRYLYFMYHTGASRMVWFQGTEDNNAAAVETILKSSGFQCAVKSQIIIGSNMGVAERITRTRKKEKDRYFTVSNSYNDCFFLTNNSDGDELLKIILDDHAQDLVNDAALSGLAPPGYSSRQFDAVTMDRKQPVSLNYKCDLLKLINFDPKPPGFQQSPIVLCLDYQVDTLQRILGPHVDVRAIRR